MLVWMDAHKHSYTAKCMYLRAQSVDLHAHLYVYMYIIIYA
jgi:hypothetical protein